MPEANTIPSTQDSTLFSNIDMVSYHIIGRFQTNIKRIMWLHKSVCV